MVDGAGNAIAAAIAAAGAIVAATAEEIAPTAPAGWVAAALLALLSAFSLWRAGSVRAWKETAQARDARIGDLESELAELRAELAIPERIEGIVRLMSETADRQDTAAAGRLELAMGRVDERWAKHDAAAEVRTQRLERGHDRLEHALAELLDAVRRDL